MNWTHPKLRPVQPEPEEQHFTSAEILVEFLTIPDDRWPETLLAHPSLATTLREELTNVRAELQRLRDEREKIIDILQNAHATLQQIEEGGGDESIQGIYPDDLGTRRFGRGI